MSVIDSLLVNLGFSIETKELNKFQHSVSGVRKSMIEFGVAAGAVGALIFENVRRFGETAEELELGARRAGVTTRAYQELADAASLVGVNQEQITQGLQQFSFVVGQALIGRGAGLQAFAMLDIHLRNANGRLKSTTTLVSEVGNALRKLPEAQRISFAQQLGFTRDSVAFLTLGGKRIKELREEVEKTGAVIDKAGIEKGVEFSEALKKLSLQFRGVKQGIQEALIPEVLSLVQSLQKYISANRKLIQQRLTTFFRGLSLTVKFVGEALLKLLSIAKLLAIPFGGLANVITALVAAFAVSKFLKVASGLFKIVLAVRALAVALFTLDIAALPIEVIIGLIIALAVAIGFVIRDIVRFSEGKSSVLGRMVKRFEIVKEIVNDVKMTFDALSNSIKLVGKELGRAGKFISKATPSGLKSSLSNEAKRLNVSGLAQGSFAKAFSTPFDLLKAPFSLGASAFRETEKLIGGSTTQHVTVNVNGAGDPQATAHAVKSVLEESARTTQRNRTNPVRG